MKSIKNNNKGFSLIEILVALVIVALAGSYVLNGFVQAARVNAQAQRIQDATDLGQVTAEIFNRKDLSVLLAGFIEKDCLNGSEAASIVLCKEDGTPLEAEKQLTSSDTTASQVKEKLEAAGPNCEVRITKLQQNLIMEDSSSQRYTIDIVLKAGKYGINSVKSDAGYTAITSTYDQQDLISQIKDEKKEVFLNDFLVPDIRETNDNLVISANDYDDSGAVEEYVEYATSYYALQKTPATDLQYDITYNGYKAALNTYLVGETTSPFYSYKITPNAYSENGIAPQRTLKVKLSCKKQAEGVYVVYVLIDGVYVFQSFTYNGVSIPQKTITKELLTEASNRSFVISTSTSSTEDVQKIYFYYNAADQKNGYYYNESDKAVNGSTDKIEISFLSAAVNAEDAAGVALINKLKESGLYLVAQKFKNVSDKESISLFKSGNASFEINTTSKSSSVFKNFECYTNMMYWNGSSVTLLKPDAVKGFITDGNNSLVNVYDMEISVKIKDQEFANIKTVKGE